MKIGDPVWLFDENRRVYSEGGRRFGGGGPIYREHFVEMRIGGETPKSWIVYQGRYEYGRIPKAGDGDGDRRQMKAHGWTQTFYLSAQAVEDDVFVHDHRGELAERVRRLDAATLRAVKALLDERKAP